MIDPMDELLEHQIHGFLSDAKEILGGLGQVFRGTAGMFDSLLESPLATFEGPRFDALKTEFDRVSRALQAAEHNIEVLTTPEGVRLLRLVNAMSGMSTAFLEAQITGDLKEEAVRKAQGFLLYLDSEPDKPPGLGDLPLIAKAYGQQLEKLLNGGGTFEMPEGEPPDQNLADIAFGFGRIDAVLSRLPRLRPDDNSPKA